jgi:hypothetical protein
MKRKNESRMFRKLILCYSNLSTSARESTTKEAKQKEKKKMKAKREVMIGLIN